MVELAVASLGFDGELGLVFHDVEYLVIDVERKKDGKHCMARMCHCACNKRVVIACQKF